MTLERLWAGWRSEYVSGVRDDGDDPCALCRISAADDDAAAYVVWRGEHTVAVLNIFPYSTGHLMLMPTRHVGEIDDLDEGEFTELWSATRDGVSAVKAAYRPEGVNLGANLGRAAGAGYPGHVHMHVVPRWSGDTNFMTAAAETRVLPEALPTTYAKLRSSWRLS